VADQRHGRGRRLALAPGVSDEKSVEVAEDGLEPFFGTGKPKFEHLQPRHESKKIDR
jgi:hypothetical protein